MVFSDTSNYSGMIQDCEMNCGFADTGISGDSSLLKHFTRLINNRYDKVVILILHSDGNIKWDDANQSTNTLYTEQNLVSGTQRYNNAVAYLNIRRIDCKDSNGNWKQLEKISQSQIKGIAIEEFYKTDGTPVYYMVEGKEIILFPAPNYTSSNGLRIYHQRGKVAFTSASTSISPGFAEPFHRLLPLGASYDYCVANELYSRLAYLDKEIKELEIGLINFYSGRDQDQKVKITLRQENFGENSGGGE